MTCIWEESVDQRMSNSFFFCYTEMNFFINSNSIFWESTNYFAITIQMKQLRRTFWIIVLRLHKMKFKNSSQFWQGPFTNVGFLYFLSQVLEDVCQKNQWGSPVYTLHSTVGPQDMQLFLHKVGLIFLLHYFEPNIKCCENWICLY